MAAHPAVAVILLGGIFAAGCATSTFITSEPRGAKVYINDRFIGETLVTRQDRSGFPNESVWVKIDKPGFKTQTVQMKKNLRADKSLLLLLPGIFPYFFSARFEDQQNFVMEYGKRLSYFLPSRSSSVTIARMPNACASTISAAVRSDHNSTIAPNPNVSVIR